MIDISMHNEVTCVKAETPSKNSVYLYLVDGMLIDTGPQILENKLIAFYNRHHFDSVTLTHSHEDHAGTASWIQKNKSVPIYIHPKGMKVCHSSADYPEYRQRAWGIRKEFQTLPLEDSIQSRHLEWEAIYTPGHADDHVSLFNKETGRLFSGDIFILPTIKVLMKSESVSKMMNSIQKLLKLDFGAMYCSHAGYLPDGREKLKTKLNNLQGIYESVMDLHKKGYSVLEIDKTLFAKKYRVEEYSKGEYSSINIVYSILSDTQS
ncbi:MBL fold metallo-hydrolase [Oceanobacillus sp. Castelsardo]|uniref:MBL fold metallo-hydrolase n=1 Tax=Oceanobacillus sp. Castelsardo TaxID=1851204 RepID=UPI00083875BC|nr:MBL fold metallo-hydrolase [Oceanobacillus sp. Castelsardo]